MLYILQKVVHTKQCINTSIGNIPIMADVFTPPKEWSLLGSVPLSFEHDSVDFDMHCTNIIKCK